MAGEPYFVKSQRLGFRWWSQDDLPLARELWGDLEVSKFFGGPFSEEEIQRRLQVELDRGIAHRFQYWPMHLLASGEFVGCCGLRPYKPDEGIPELGFHLRPKFWGRGLAPEAAKAVIDCAFAKLGAKALSAGHHPENVNSKKVLEKLGFYYTHCELFPALAIEIPYYLLRRPR
ncbi:MAG TPA: GNAT family N-acetyltransferase [Candidatus Acidoferrum sp.]|nr:GNAT family N-acetyltransferase [Candidatus Acidoferrum sp.]